MNAIDIYRAQYEEEKGWYRSGPEPDSKYTWAANRIFNLTTYDSSLNELFVKNILEVCKVILEDRNYEYIEDRENYIKYILVCQLLEEFDWIEWGTSIRGAWFDTDIFYNILEKKYINRSRDILDELEWWDDEHHKIEKVPFTVDNLKSLIKFMEE